MIDRVRRTAEQLEAYTDYFYREIQIEYHFFYTDSLLYVFLAEYCNIRLNNIKKLA